MQLHGKIAAMLLFSIALLTSGCGGSSTSGGSTPTPTPAPTPTPTPSTTGEWTWVGGSDTANAVGVYGTQGIAAASNVPGARSGSVSWTDGSGDLWLFGGSGNVSAGVAGGDLNDLWEFSPATKEWTWISGSNTANADGDFSESGVYGTQGVASANNVPPPRDSAVSWTDSSGNLWLFGGEGFISSTMDGMFNDLWEFNPTSKEWTWVSGSDKPGAKGTYGTLGTASSSNVPGARGSGGGGASVSWTDTSGNLWLFGGQGYYSTGNQSYLNDLWKFIPTAKTWTWVGGSDTANAVGVYGTQGIAAANNVPGARSYSVSWRDNSGNFWLYGGEGYGPTGTANGDLSDLWKFSPTTKEWTWVNGSNAGSVDPVYGTQGVASTSNTPGGRDSSVGWADNSGNLWLFGGFDYDTASGSNGTNDFLNDLWKFSATTKEWTWMGGRNTGNANGVYGTLGTPSASNVPGARGSEGIAVTWTDSSGNFWLFGGDGYDSTGIYDGLLNDLWRYQP